MLHPAGSAVASSPVPELSPSSSSHSHADPDVAAAAAANADAVAASTVIPALPASVSETTETAAVKLVHSLSLSRHNSNAYAHSHSHGPSHTSSSANLSSNGNYAADAIGASGGVHSAYAHANAGVGGPIAEAYGGNDTDAESTDGHTVTVTSDDPSLAAADAADSADGAGLSGEHKPMPPDLASHVVLLKVLYFLQGMSAASWGRFGTIYYLSRGLTRFEIGIIEGLIPSITMFASPIWGIVADKLHSRKKVALFTQSVSVCILCLLAFPALASGFESILAISMLMAAFVSSGILDAHTLDVLGKDYFYAYGPIRMWTSISWGIGALFLGFLTDSFSVYSIFVVYAILATTSIVATSRVVPEQTHNEARRAVGPPPQLSALFRALTRPRMLFFLF